MTPQLEHFFKSILKIYKRLIELGFIYLDGKVSILDIEEEENEK